MRRNRNALAVARTPVRERCDRAVDVAERARLREAPHGTLPRFVRAAVEEEARDEQAGSPLPRLAVNPDDVRWIGVEELTTVCAKRVDEVERARVVVVERKAHDAAAELRRVVEALRAEVEEPERGGVVAREEALHVDERISIERRRAFRGKSEGNDRFLSRAREDEAEAEEGQSSQW